MRIHKVASNLGLLCILKISEDDNVFSTMVFKSWGLAIVRFYICKPNMTNLLSQCGFLQKLKEMTKESKIKGKCLWGSRWERPTNLYVSDLTDESLHSIYLIKGKWIKQLKYLKKEGIKQPVTCKLCSSACKIFYIN